jgi:5-methyltetrahydropteroyltriglutamate--homocysteine methyltransferase
MARRAGLLELRVDQVGSLLRPASLIQAFLSCAKGEMTRDALDRLVAQAVRDVVAKQAAIGFPVVTDGEFGRINWHVSFSQIEGWALDEASWRSFLANPAMRHEHEHANTLGADAVESYKTPATARLRLLSNFPLGEYRRLAALTTVPGKAMLMGPDRVSQMCDLPASKPIYESTDAFLADVVAVQSRMVGELVEAGCPYVQLDEPSYTGYVDRATLERMRARGEDPMANLRRAIRASNAVVEGHAGKAVFGIHICRGNRASMWHRQGTYDGIAEELFSTLRFDRLLLEYDTARAGGFEPLRFVPKGPPGQAPIVVLGLVTTKTGEVETVDSLRRRIDEASRFIDPAQLAISPQCGFASGMSGNDLGHDQQWRKLEVILETARRVWH